MKLFTKVFRNTNGDNIGIHFRTVEGIVNTVYLDEVAAFKLMERLAKTIYPDHEPFLVSHDLVRKFIKDSPSTKAPWTLKPEIHLHTTTPNAGRIWTNWDEVPVGVLVETIGDGGTVAKTGTHDRFLKFANGNIAAFWAKEHGHATIPQYFRAGDLVFAESALPFREVPK